MGGLHTAPVDLLKIFVKMGASWSAQVLRQAGDTLSGPGAFLLFSLKTWRMPSFFSAGVGDRGFLEVLIVVWRGVQGGCGVFSKSTVKVIEIICQLLILQSAGGWCQFVMSLEDNLFLSLPRIIPLCHSDLLFQCVFSLLIQEDNIPLSVSIFFGLTELSEFCSEPWFVIVVG